MSAPTLPPRIVCVVVDGFNFAENTCWIEHAYPELLEFIRRELSNRIPAGQDIIIAQDGIHLFTPDVAKLNRAGQLGEAQYKSQSHLLSKLRHGELGLAPGEPGYKWTVHESLLKRDPKTNRLVASGEDINFAMTVNALAEKEALKPIGADPRKATATDIFLVTSDGDHLATLDGGPSEVLRWCVISNPCKSLQRWGEQSRRCLVFKTAETKHGGVQFRGGVAPGPNSGEVFGRDAGGVSQQALRQLGARSAHGGSSACFNCGREGHWSRECPLNNHNNGVDQQQQQQNKNNSRRTQRNDDDDDDGADASNAVLQHRAPPGVVTSAANNQDQPKSKAQQQHQQQRTVVEVPKDKTFEICLDFYRGFCPLGKPHCPYPHYSQKDGFCHQYLNSGACSRQRSSKGCPFYHALGIRNRHLDEDSAPPPPPPPFDVRTATAEEQQRSARSRNSNSQKDDGDGDDDVVHVQPPAPTTMMPSSSVRNDVPPPPVGGAQHPPAPAPAASSAGFPASDIASLVTCFNISEDAAVNSLRKARGDVKFAGALILEGI